VDLVERKSACARRHPWELARAEFFLSLLRRRALVENATDWLDVGAGDAWFARQLRRVLPSGANLTCWDVNYSAEDLARLKDLESEGISFLVDRPSGRFDRILMLDVLEHVEADTDFVRSTVADLLAEEGVILVSVPAYQALFSSHDRALRHHRRYSPAAGRRLLQRSGLVVLADGGLFHTLLPVRLGQVLIERARGARSLSSGIGDWQAGTTVTSALTRALSTDARLSLSLSERGLSLPGLSYWALCALQSA
jgi:SAM-dependent methyltransferase